MSTDGGFEYGLEWPNGFVSGGQANTASATALFDRLSRPGHEPKPVFSLMSGSQGPMTRRATRT